MNMQTSTVRIVVAAVFAATVGASGVYSPTVCECVMPKDEFDGLPVIDVPESEGITVAVKSDDFDKRDMADPEQHPIAVALRRQRGIDDARVSKREVLIGRGKKWFRYGAPKRVS